jgi:peptidoglycan/xylan/chitin deacetylase (PgdA/CDA1 family)
VNILKSILLNPIVLIVPIVGIVLAGWQQHVALAQQPSLSSSPYNILPNAGFEEVDENGQAAGWKLNNGSPSVQAVIQSGYSSPKSLLVLNSNNQSGNSTLTSPVANVQSGKNYLYKGYYKSSMPFDLLTRRNYKDGSSRLKIVKHYEPSSLWTTASSSFTAEPNIQSVQFMYGFADAGRLQLDNSYLEADPTSAYIAPSPAQVGDNLIQNASLVSADGASPDKWNRFTTGNNHTDFSYIADSMPAHLRTQVSSYQDGEAKWQHDPVAVKPGQYLQFDVSYLSDRPVDIVAEYTLSSGARKFNTLASLMPANDWTDYTGRFVAPADATHVVVSVVLHGNGVLNTKNYSLYDISKPGALNWKQARVSLTFDDGWESDYTDGAKLLGQYGYKGTFYLNPSSIDTPSFMTSDQVTSLSNSGHELASHGYEHQDFRALSKQSVNYQLEHAASYFSQTFHKKSVNFATPFGGSDPEVEYYARKYYASHRGTESGINTRQNIDPYNLKIFYVGNDTPLTKLNEALAETKASNAWLILVYHRISTESNETTINPVTFQQQLDAVQHSGASVKTVAAALQEVKHE